MGSSTSISQRGQIVHFVVDGANKNNISARIVIHKKKKWVNISQTKVTISLNQSFSRRSQTTEDTLNGSDRLLGRADEEVRAFALPL